MSAETPTTSHGRGIWWFILGFTGAVSLTLNIWHALTTPAEPVTKAAAAAAKATANGVDPGRVVLALIVGVLPVAMAACLSHTFVIAVPWQVRWVVTGLFLYGMAMSLTAQVEVLLPVTGDVWRAIGVPVLVDVPALLALYMLARRPSVEPVGEQPLADPAPVAEPIVEPVVDRLPTGQEASAEAVERPVADRLPIEAGPVAEAVAQPVTPVVEDRLPAAPEAVERPVAEPVTPPVVEDPRPVAEPVVKRTRNRSKARADRSKTAPAAGMSTKDRARLLLADNPDMNGADLGRELGVSPERGRALRREVEREIADQGNTEGASVIAFRAAQ